MSVSSTVRRQGIGRRLLETTEDFCLEKVTRGLVCPRSVSCSPLSPCIGGTIIRPWKKNRTATRPTSRWPFIT